MSLATLKNDPSAEWKLDWFKIFIIDDEPTNIEILTEMLNSAGYCQIFSTTDPTRALALFEVNQPDLVLLDLQMPQLHGMEVLKQIKESDLDNAVPVMILTADQSRSARLNALNLGAKDFICKPFDLVEVTARIHNLMETRYAYRNLNHKNKALDLIVQARARSLHQNHRHLQKLNQDLEKRVDQRTKELNDVNKKLRKSNDAMFDLISIVAHEFRTPLTSIKGFAEILREDNDSLDDEGRANFLNIIVNEADRLNRLVTNLLDLQKIDAGKMEWKQDDINLCAILSESAEISRPAYNAKNIALNIESKHKIAHVVGDQDKLQQVFMNLLSNALKFTNQGQVTIELVTTSHWANMIFLSNNPGSIEACKKLAVSLESNLAIYSDAERLQNYLDANSRRTSIVLIDMDRGASAIEIVDNLRHRYPDLPVASLYGESPSPVDRQSDDYEWKPLQLGTHDKKICSLIRDAVGSDPKSPMYKVTVMDTGIGIPEDQREKVFTRFHQANRSDTREQRGTGLGLPICEEIIKHHHGKIWLDSHPEKGSTLTVLLPVPVMDKKPLGEILIEQGIATEDQINNALKEQNK